LLCPLHPIKQRHNSNKSRVRARLSAKKARSRFRGLAEAQQLPNPWSRSQMFQFPSVIWACTA
ncbi:MAG: hypothetical protein ACK55Z_14160, partial [bacterium]